MTTFNNSDFNTLVNFFHSNNFTVCVNTINSKVISTRFNFAKVEGKNIIGGFCVNNKFSDTAINGCLALDHYDSFTIWEHCPAIFKLPLSDYSDLIPLIDFLGKDTGDSLFIIKEFYHNYQWKMLIKNVKSKEISSSRCLDEHHKIYSFC